MVADDDMSGETGAEGEVVHRDEQGRRYAVVATTRPETIMGDTASVYQPRRREEPLAERQKSDCSVGRPRNSGH